MATASFAGTTPYAALFPKCHVLFFPKWHEKALLQFYYAERHNGLQNFLSTFFLMMQIPSCKTTVLAVVVKGMSDNSGEPSMRF